VKKEYLCVDQVTLVLNGVAVLDNVSLSNSTGEVLGISGRNGSGKSMLFKCIAGLIIPTSGEIIVDGFEVVSQKRFPPRMGALIEKPGFIGSLSGYENLKLLASIRNEIGKEEILKAIYAVGLSDEQARMHVRKYSLGMKQRLGIAQAIMENPKLLILDEPTSGLDSDGVEVLREIIKQQAHKGVCVLLASHIKEDMDLLCDRVLTMENGNLSANLE